jgi:hypothetical protein
MKGIQQRPAQPPNMTLEQVKLQDPFVRRRHHPEMAMVGDYAAPIRAFLKRRLPCAASEFHRTIANLTGVKFGENLGGFQCLKYVFRASQQALFW